MKTPRLVRLADSALDVGLAMMVWAIVDHAGIHVSFVKLGVGYIVLAVCLFVAALLLAAHAESKS